MKSPQTAETIPAGFLAGIQAQKAILQRQLSEVKGALSEISTIETMCVQYAQGGGASGGLSTDTIVKTPRRRGRPAAKQNGQQRPSAGTPAKNASSGTRPSPETVALEALNTFSHGATDVQIKAWVDQRYGTGAYLPQYLKVALNRAWVSRKIGSNGPIVKGVKFEGLYYSLDRMPANAIMAPEKVETAKRTGTTG